jgi:CO/xanthine dehydrogenase FAD-binding subunit
MKRRASPLGAATWTGLERPLATGCRRGAAFAAAGAAARDAVTGAREDLHASAEHRRRLAAVVVERALRAASARAERRA